MVGIAGTLVNLARAGLDNKRNQLCAVRAIVLHVIQRFWHCFTRAEAACDRTIHSLLARASDQAIALGTHTQKKKDAR